MLNNNVIFKLLITTAYRPQTQDSIAVNLSSEYLYKI